MVLDHATPQDLLLWQRVNKAWQAAIQGSLRIQERLFFRIRETCETVPHKRVVVANPFLNFFAHKSSEADYFFLDDAFEGKASHPTASWRQMYMRSPVETLFVVGIVLKQGGLRNGFQFGCETGITIGQFADALKEHITRFPRDGEVPKCFFCTLRW